MMNFLNYFYFNINFKLMIISRIKNNSELLKYFSPHQIIYFYFIKSKKLADEILCRFMVFLNSKIMTANLFTKIKSLKMT